MPDKKSISYQQRYQLELGKIFDFAKMFVLRVLLELFNIFFALQFKLLIYWGYMVIQLVIQSWLYVYEDSQSIRSWCRLDLDQRTNANWSGKLTVGIKGVELWFWFFVVAEKEKLLTGNVLGGYFVVCQLKSFLAACFFNNL